MPNKMIIKNKIDQLRKGYPTISDKYNVAGGILESSSADAEYGDLIMYGTTTGYYKKAVNIAAATDIAGVLLATNVKLTGTWPDDGATTTKTKKGEAFNLMLDGYVAIQLDAAYTPAETMAGKKLAVILATGKLTTLDKVAAGIIEMPGYYFTGIVENGLAEIEIRR